MTRLVQLADIHFGREDKPAINAAAELIPNLEADGIVVCGDLTQRGKSSEFEAAEAWLNALDTPFASVPGNHDTPLLNLFSRVTSPFARFKSRFGETFTQCRFGKAMLHGLNTARGWQVRKNWAEGSVNLDDLRDLLDGAEKEDAQIHVMSCHHPFVSPPGVKLQTRTRRGHRADQLLAQSSVSMLLCGHVHTPSATVRTSDDGAYLCLTAGTLSTRLRDWPSSFNVIDVDANDITVRQFNFKDDRFEERISGKWSLKELEPASV
ncbi:MAG: hypothetical protein CMK07_11880 [Ponticaulis sp.]|nr:hypothetical protein [Ponticaulis sp.]